MANILLILLVLTFTSCALCLSEHVQEKLVVKKENDHGHIHEVKKVIKEEEPHHIPAAGHIDTINDKSKIVAEKQIHDSRHKIVKRQYYGPSGSGGVIKEKIKIEEKPRWGLGGLFGNREKVIIKKKEYVGPGGQLQGYGAYGGGQSYGGYGGQGYGAYGGQGYGAYGGQGYGAYGG